MPRRKKRANRSGNVLSRFFQATLPPPYIIAYFRPGFRLFSHLRDRKERESLPARFKLILAAKTLEKCRKAMSAIAEQLDAKLKTLDAKAASSLEKLVRGALELVEAQNGGRQP